MAAGAVDTPEDVLKQIYQLEGRGEVAKVAEVCRGFVKDWPDHSQSTDVHFRLSKALDSLGLTDEAIPHLQDVVRPDKKTYKDRGEAFLLLGKLLAGRRDYAGATKALEDLLAEGAGLHEEEALNLCGTYYAMFDKYDEAAAKLNILKLKQDSPLAEQAAFKIAQLWLKAKKTDLAVGAIEELANRYPNNPRLPELLLQLAQNFCEANENEKAIAVSEQLKTRYPKSVESYAGRFILGLCYRDRKEYQKAVELLVPLGSVLDFQKLGLAAEAMVAAGDIYFTQLNDTSKAMECYEEAARHARDSESERRRDILEYCYLRLAENHFMQKHWAAALDYYLMLRSLGTQFNVLPRITKCQEELGTAGQSVQYTDKDIEQFKKVIADNPGTPLAAETELYLVDRRLHDAEQGQRTIAGFRGDYEAILKRYSKEVLAKEHMESYVHFQLGLCYAAGDTLPDYVKAVREFETVLACEPGGPYKIPAMEHVALYAEKAGDKAKTLATYEELYKLTTEGAAAAAKGKKDDGTARSVEYLRALASRSTSQDLIEKTISWLKNIIEQKGALSDDAREARFYLGELYFVKKNFAAAAAAYKDFIQIYGPKLDATGNVANPPWQPRSVDAKVEQVYEAAVRIAHCYYMQGYEQAKMVEAYRWMVKNLSYQNPYMPEALYWLAMELGKGEQGQTNEGKHKMADALWKTMVHPSLEFDAPNYSKGFHAWANPKSSSAWEGAEKYVRNAMLRAGQLYSEIGEHQTAAGVFEQFLQRYPLAAAKDGGQKRGGGGGGKTSGRDAQTEDMSATATYALGREYAFLKKIPKLIETYKVYVNHLRENPYRVSALKLLAYQAGTAERYDDAIDAYATLLDEYGANTVDAKGNPVPVPRASRLRQGQSTWDGIRMDPPKGLDLGEIRYNLGYLYWKQQDFERAAQALMPFVDQKPLQGNKMRDTALYMLGQSCLKRFDYASAAKAFQTLLSQHPKFEALEEAYTYSARCYLETAQWTELETIYRRFTGEWPRSDFRPRMDYYSAVAAMNQGKTDAGLRTLKGMAGSDVFEDVKADAAYQAGKYYASATPPDLAQAFQLLDRSVSLFPREASCVELAKVCMKQRNWDRALVLLQRVLRDFTQGDRRYLSEAERLLPEAQREVQKKAKKGG